MLARPAALLALALLVAPLAGAAAPGVPDTSSAIVISHQTYDYATHMFCTSSDPALAFVNTDLTSRMTVTPVSAGVNSFALHFDQTLPDAAFGSTPGCPAMDIAFTSGLAWPAASQFQFSSYSMACGASGTVTMQTFGATTYFWLWVSNAPAACGLPVQTGEIDWGIGNVHPSNELVCSPLVATLCAGAYTSTYHNYGCASHPDVDRFNVVVGIDVLYVEHSCQWWTDGREHVSVNDGVLGIVSIDTTSDSCTVWVYDFFGLVGNQSAPCPDQVRSAIYDTDWMHTLP